MTPDPIREAAKKVIATSADAEIVPSPQALAEFEALVDERQAQAAESAAGEGGDG